jgi:two-component system sensor histidine kinase PhoQ
VTLSAIKSSLFLRLLFVAAIGLVLAMMAIGLATQRAFVGVAEEARGDRLESVVMLLLASMEVDEQGRPVVSDDLAEPKLGQPGSGLYGGIMTATGSWVSPSAINLDEVPDWRSMHAGISRFYGPSERSGLLTYQSGLVWEAFDGERMEFQVWAAEGSGRLDSQVAAFRHTLWRWMSISLLLIVAVQLLLLLVFMRPLRKLAREVREIESGHRSVLSDRYPKELRVLSSNLNRLLDWERERGRKYQNAIADLAHALKTPISALQARLQSQRSVDREALLSDVRQVDNLLARQLERISIATRGVMQPWIRILPVIERVCGSVQRLYSTPKTALKIAIACEPDLKVQVEERDLTEILGNVIENAAKYGSGKISITATRTNDMIRGQGVRVTIHDDGPGIEAQKFEYLLQRGVRGDQRHESQGQGLGLAIVADLMDSYSAQIQLGNSEYLGGAAIDLYFWCIEHRSL